MNRTVRFGVGVVPCAPVTEVASAIRSAEERGFDTAWVGDSQLLWRDTYAALALAATRTTSIRLASAVSNPLTRHPTVLASAANTIAELAPGRFVLGLGSGESAVKPLGLRPATRAAMRSAITEVRTLLDGRSIAAGDREIGLRRPVETVPIYLATSGPRTTRLAGEVADGGITLAGSSPELVRRFRSGLLAGRAVDGAPTGDPEIVVGTFCRVTDDVERDARALKPICAYVATNPGGREYLRAAGIDIGEPDVPPDLHPDLVHAEDWDAAVRYASRFVTDETVLRFAERFCLFGSVDCIVERILDAVDAGATDFYLRHLMSYSLPHELIEAFGEEVLPRVRAALAPASATRGLDAVTTRRPADASRRRR